MDQSDLTSLVIAVAVLANIVKLQDSLLREITAQLNPVTGELPLLPLFLCKEALPVKTYGDLQTFEDTSDPN